MICLYYTKLCRPIIDVVTLIDDSIVKTLYVIPIYSHRQGSSYGFNE